MKVATAKVAVPPKHTPATIQQPASEQPTTNNQQQQHHLVGGFNPSEKY